MLVAPVGTAEAMVSAIRATVRLGIPVAPAGTVGAMVNAIRTDDRRRQASEMPVGIACRRSSKAVWIGSIRPSAPLRSFVFSDCRTLGEAI